MRDPRKVEDFKIRILRLMERSTWNQVNFMNPPTLAYDHLKDTYQLQNDMDGSSDGPLDEVLTQNPSVIPADLGSYGNGGKHPSAPASNRSSVVDILSEAYCEHPHSATINNASREHTGLQVSSNENSGSPSHTPTLESTWVKQKRHFDELCRYIESYASYYYMENNYSYVPWNKETISELESKTLSEYSD